MADNWVSIQAAAAKALATKVAGQNDPNRYALDRAMRVVRTLERLAAALPKKQRPARVDLARVAALYACVVYTANPGQNHNADRLDDAAELAAEQLHGHLASGDVDLTIRILREHRRKDTQLAEARLLSDAMALEDVGLVGLWNVTRQFHAQGRMLEQLVKSWRTQQDYGYWENRLRDGFHFAVSRQVAADRLKQIGPVYEQLQAQAQGEDIVADGAAG